MAESIKEKILQDIEATLRGITLAAGYANDIGSVERGMVSPVEIQAFPAALIIPTADNPEAGPSSVKRRAFSLSLRLWVAVHKEASSHLESFIADVERAMMVDPRRGALAFDTEEGNTTYLYLVEKEAQAGGEIEYTIYYRTQIGDPSVIA